MKKFWILLVLSALLLTGCGGREKFVHCDGCGAQIPLEENSKITEDWIVFCKTCEQEKFSGGVVGP